jgi:Na+/H+ antiporter NhaB
MMTNLTNLIAFLVYGITVATLIVLVIVFSVKAKRYQSEMLTAKLQVIALVDKMEKDAQSSSVEKTEGFLKFVSDSRDWAFKYIEDVQEAIEALRVAIDSDDPEADVELAYEVLISFLPNDDMVE